MSAFTVSVKAGLQKETPAKRQPAIETPKPPSRIARQLALAHYIERLVEEGKIKNYADAADAARRFGITRARMTQVMNLMNLPLIIQEQILRGNETKLSERGLRNPSSPTQSGLIATEPHPSPLRLAMSLQYRQPLH